MRSLTLKCNSFRGEFKRLRMSIWRHNKLNILRKVNHLYMSAVAALVKYNPCSVHARRGIACPFFLPGIGKQCHKPRGFCDSPEYDGWLKDVLQGKTKCFYPNRIRLFELPGAILVLYHVDKRAIIGEAKILRATSEKKMHYYWFDKFLLYPNPVGLKLLHTDSRMRELARRGKWRTMYLSQQTVEEIRELSGLEGESKERLRRELELAKEEAERRRSYFLRDSVSIPELENRKLMESGVENEILKKAEEIFSEVAKRKLLRGRSSKYMFYSSLYMAFRLSCVPKRLKEIQEMGNLNPKQFVSSVRFLMKNLEVKLPPISPKEWILRYSKNLTVSEETVQAAINLAEVMKNEKSFKNKSPLSIAATALYLTSHKVNENIKQERIAKTFGVTAVTLRNLTKLWLNRSENL
uniref:Transcription initiation factor IIB family protein n=1 Tax=Caldisericum exile TaxID=693075 RepID=A0A7C4U342_9BACT